MSKIANRYAVALFELAVEEDQIDRYQQQLAWIKEVFNDDTVFQFFSSIKVDKLKKKEMLSTIMQDQVDQHMISFLMILIDKKRVSFIKAIADQFHSLCNKHYNIQEGYVYSIRKLSEQEHKEIEDAVSKKLNSTVKLKNYLNPHLIAGVKVVVNDTVIDASYQAQMSQLKAQLLKESR